MVFLHQQGGSSRKRHSSFNTPFPQQKVHKSAIDSVAVGTNERETSPPQSQPQPQPAVVGELVSVDEMVSILAEAGCTLINPAGPPCLPTDHHKFRCHLHRTFTSGAARRSAFLADLAVYTESPRNLLRVLTSSSPDAYFTPRCNSLVRNLLLVPSIQLDVQKLLLEKLPEYFEVNPGLQDIYIPLRDDVPRLIINHFRWLDFVVDCNAFNDMLLQVLSICPIQLKKEIIGSLPEIVGDQNNKSVVYYLEQLLQEDSSIIVPVLDSLSNLHLDDELKEQVITIALSCIRTIDGEHMPYLFRFLVLSATPANSRRIISKIREQLKFVGVSNHFASQDKNKLKGKPLLDSTDASILDTLRSGLRFNNILCQEMLKEFSCLQKPQDHKVIDIWLLVLIYANGENAKRTIEKILKKKVNDGCIQEILIDQCMHGHADLVKANFPSFLALSEYLLACKEQRAREFSIHMYTCLFEELADTYSRQEVLGALVTHIGSGVNFEVTSALETLKLLVSKYSQDLISLSCHINGILDYMEGFSFENLNKVYEVFSQLALFGSCSVNSFRSSIADELIVIVRKQLNHPNLAYKKMGLIGTLKIVACIGNLNNIACAEQIEKSNCGEALELLETSLESCKHLASPLIFLYDEMAYMLNNKSLHPAFMEWIAKHAGELEYTFLSDLQGGQLPSRNADCGLEGELWMNLDGDISPVCLNILPLVVSSNQSSLLQILPSNLQLLSTIERSTNQGSLGGIDALLGCPLHMPASKYFRKDAWQSLTGKQKQLVCLSLYYAANWIRELLNGFSSQVAGEFQSTSQTAKEDIITKLMKRFRNLVFLETLLSKFLESCPLSLPKLHHQFDHSLPSHSKQAFGYDDKSELKRVSNLASPKLKKNKRIAKSQTDSSTDGKLRQPTIVDVLKKAGVLTNQAEANDHSCTLPSRSTSHSADQNSSGYEESISVEVSTATKILDLQRFKFRTLQLQCYSIMTFPKNKNTCCSDPLAELPVYLYILRDLRYKLDCFTISGRKCGRFDICGSKLRSLFQKIRPLFPSLKKNFDNAMILLREGENGCQGHWEAQSCSSGNPILSNVFHSKTSSSSSFIEEILHFLNKILDLPHIQMDKTILLDVLSAFQPIKVLDLDFPGVQPYPVPGSIEYLYCGAYSFLEDVLDKACSFSFIVASESLLSLETLVRLAQKCNQKNDLHTKLEFSEGLLLNLNRRLGIAAEKVMKHSWDDKNIENGWKRQGERVQKLLRIYLENSGCTSTLLNQIACSVLPEVSLYQTAAQEDAHHGFSTLGSATYLIWYRVLHEVNLTVLHTLVKEISLSKAGEIIRDKAKEHLTELLKLVNVLVSLVNICRTHDKVTLHAMSVKFGGKFIDTFMKVFDFLQAQFQVQNNELVMQIVKELQKATRTLQTLCSEAKGSKRTAITSKVPGMKRTLERFLFRVKALVVATSSGCTFWMGNLKHKDLAGQVVSSQAYLDESVDMMGAREVVDDVDDDDDEPPIAAVPTNQRTG